MSRKVADYRGKEISLVFDDGKFLITNIFNDVEDVELFGLQIDEKNVESLKWMCDVALEKMKEYVDGGKHD